MLGGPVLVDLESDRYHLPERKITLPAHRNRLAFCRIRAPADLNSGSHSSVAIGFLGGVTRPARDSGTSQARNSSLFQRSARLNE